MNPKHFYRDEQSLRPKVEIKNLNSFKAVHSAILFEIKRQAEIYDKDETLCQQTRLWDEKDAETKLMRLKEGESDYRYFPEPDIPLMSLQEEVLEKWRGEIRELPGAKRQRYINSYQV